MHFNTQGTSLETYLVENCSVLKTFDQSGGNIPGSQEPSPYCNPYGNLVRSTLLQEITHL